MPVTGISRRSPHAGEWWLELLVRTPTPIEVQRRRRTSTERCWEFGPRKGNHLSGSKKAKRPIKHG
jgi:hypothetical protein